MRVNVYAEEITGEVVVRTKTVPGNGKDKTFHGLQFVLASSDKLHHRLGDDDRSGVTFWLPTNYDQRMSFINALETAVAIAKSYNSPDGGAVAAYREPF